MLAGSDAESPRSHDVVLGKQGGTSQNLLAGTFVTCLAAMIDFEQGTISYAIAGRASGVVTGPWGERALSMGGPAPGARCGSEYRTETVVFADGDVLVFVSRGAADALNAPADLVPFVIAEEILRAPSLAPKDICEHLLGVTRRPRRADKSPGTDARAVVALALASRS